jgi:hypothetical protein
MTRVCAKLFFMLFYSFSLDAIAGGKVETGPVSETIHVIKGGERVVHTDWLRERKFDAHVVVLKFQGKASNLNAFKVKRPKDLFVAQWYREPSGKPARRELGEEVLPIDKQVLILEIGDNRPFEIYEAEYKKNKTTMFQLALVLFNSEKKESDLLIQISGKHGRPTTPRSKSYLDKWYSSKP